MTELSGITPNRAVLTCSVEVSNDSHDRAFQKVARKYYSDPQHLTDVVQCCIVLKCIDDLRRVLDQLFERSVIFSENTVGNAEARRTGVEDGEEQPDEKEEHEEAPLGGEKPTPHFTLGSKWRNAGAELPQGSRKLLNSKLSKALGRKVDFPAQEWGGFCITDLSKRDCIKSGAFYFTPVAKVFKHCKVKDDFARDGLGYRHFCLNLEVGWTIESESGDGIRFVTVEDFQRKHAYCEVQVLLKSTYELQVNGCHNNFVKARNMLAQ